MRRTILVVPLLVIGTVVLAPSAEAIQDPLTLHTAKVRKVKTPPKTKSVVTTPVTPGVIEYVVQEGDSLSKIAELKSTSWQRIWQKNPQLSNPDTLSVGDKLTIPSATEILADRQAPAASSVPVSTRLPVPGNGYDWGQCTFFVKTKRPDIGNYWGNADQWGYSARAAGYEVNNTPTVGSIGVATNYMHVVYIEAVNGDGTVTLSEMNYVSLGVISTRVAPISEFVYIH